MVNGIRLIEPPPRKAIAEAERPGEQRCPESTAYRGVFPVVPTIFDDSGELDLEGQRRAIDFMIDAGADGICILANYSEQFVLTDAERDQSCGRRSRQSAGRVPMIVTTTHFGTAHRAERSRRAQEAGAAMVMLMPPYHGATLRVDEAGDLRVLPQRGGRDRHPDHDPGRAGQRHAAPARPSSPAWRGEIAHVAYFKIETPQAAGKLRELIAPGGDAIVGPFDGEEAITLIADLDAGATGTMPAALPRRLRPGRRPLPRRRPGGGGRRLRPLAAADQLREPAVRPAGHQGADGGGRRHPQRRCRARRCCRCTRRRAPGCSKWRGGSIRSSCAGAGEPPRLCLAAPLPPPQNSFRNETGARGGVSGREGAQDGAGKGRRSAPSPDFVAPLGRENLAARAYEELRRALFEGRLRPGQRLKVRALSAAMQVSETPVREAMMQLVRDRVLRQEAARAITVAGLTLDQYLELQTIRMELEGLAAEGAALRIAPAAIEALAACHVALMAGSGQPSHGDMPRQRLPRHRRARAGLHHSPAGEHHDGVGDRQGEIEVLLHEQHDRRPSALRSPPRSPRRSRAGCPPSARRGGARAAGWRAPARWRAAAAGRPKVAAGRLPEAAERREQAAPPPRRPRSRSSPWARAATRRFSATVRSAKISRPWGT